MKTSLFLTAALATLLFSTSALAYSPKDSQQQVKGPISTLVLSKVVSPSDLPSSFTRQVVQIEFSIDQAGQPQGIKILTKADTAAKEQIVKAFKQWKFELTTSEADRSGTRFILPLEIVPKT